MNWRERWVKGGRERGALGEKVGKSPKCDGGGEERVVRKWCVEGVGRDRRWLR